MWGFRSTAPYSRTVHQGGACSKSHCCYLGTSCCSSVWRCNRWELAFLHMLSTCLFQERFCCMNQGPCYHWMQHCHNDCSTWDLTEVSLQDTLRWNRFQYKVIHDLIWFDGVSFLSDRKGRAFVRAEGHTQISLPLSTDSQGECRRRQRDRCRTRRDRTYATLAIVKLYMSVFTVDTKYTWTPYQSL